MEKAKSSQSVPIPLLTMRPAGEEEAKPSGSHGKRKLQLLTTSHFRLPDGWYVEEKRRPLSNTSRPGQIDKHYIDPGTGLKFRSLPAVQRYLTEGKIEARTMKLKPGGESTMQYTPRTRSTSTFVLPDDWKIEEKPRNNSHVIDKTYIEPGTGQRFRSLVSVERYLTGTNEDTSLKALEPANMCSLSPVSGHQRMKNFGEIQSQKVFTTYMERNISGENDKSSKLNFGDPPTKVNWVLGGPGGNMGNVWNPFVHESKVPYSVQQKWSETFISSIYGATGNISGPSFYKL